MTKIVVCGASSIEGINNFGDKLIRDIPMQWLREADAAIEFVYLPYRGLGRGVKEWRETIRGSDGLLYVGGGYLGEQSYPTRNCLQAWLLRMAWGFRNGHLFAEPAKLARSLGVPYGIVGVEFGPITNPIFRRRAVALLNGAAVASVRNEESASFARAYGVKRVPAVLPDLALTLSRTQGRKPAGKPKRLALHIHSGEVFKQENYLLAVRTLVDALLGASQPGAWEIVYLHDQVIRGAPKQRANDAKGVLQKAFPGLLEKEYADHWKLVEYMHTLNYVVTTKLHVGIVGRALKIPVLSLSTHVKTPRFYRLIGEPWACLEPDRLSSQEISLAVHEAIKKNGVFPSPIRKGPRERALKNRQLVLDFLAMLA